MWLSCVNLRLTEDFLGICAIHGATKVWATISNGSMYLNVRLQML